MAHERQPEKVTSRFKRRLSKRSLNAYFIFLMQFRKDMARENIRPTKLAQLAGARWREMNHEEKLPYIQLAEDAKRGSKTRPVRRRKSKNTKPVRGRKSRSRKSVRRRKSRSTKRSRGSRREISIRKPRKRVKQIYRRRRRSSYY